MGAERSIIPWKVPPTGAESRFIPRKVPPTGAESRFIPWKVPPTGAGSSFIPWKVPPAGAESRFIPWKVPPTGADEIADPWPSSRTSFTPSATAHTHHASPDPKDAGHASQAPTALLSLSIAPASFCSETSCSRAFDAIFEAAARSCSPPRDCDLWLTLSWFTMLEMFSMAPVI
jgi:hypothetical protein